MLQSVLSPGKPRTGLEEPFLSFSNSKLSNSYTKTVADDLDRFIPRKLDFGAFKLDLQLHNDPEQQPAQSLSSDTNLNESLRQKSSMETYKKMLRQSLKAQDKLLSYHSPAKHKKAKSYHLKHKDMILSYSPSSLMMLDFAEQEGQIGDTAIEEAEPIRKIAKQPYKILEAPNLDDDFYHNVLDWNKNNLIAVAMDESAYIWNGKENEAEKLAQGRFSAIKWGPKGLAMGSISGDVKIIDAEKKHEVFRFKSHLSRVGTIDFYNNLMVTGSKDEHIYIVDTRMSGREAVQTYTGHRQEVCGVRFSFDGANLASGGSDNAVFIWSTKMNKPLSAFRQHTAAVKALAWSPHKHSILASGGGTSDRSIKIWSSSELKMLKSVDTGSQVCNMMYSENTDQIISTHGYTHNMIAVWRQKDMKKIASLYGHLKRVLYLAMSPDGESVVTGSGDQTLRFWKVFPQAKRNKWMEKSGLDLLNYNIR